MPARILLAEDNPINLRIALRMLVHLGFDVDQATSGVEALERLLGSARPFDLILMDCDMPEMDGYECSRRVRELADTRLRATPIIAFTSDASEENRARCLECGMNDLLAKPTDTLRLGSLICTWLALPPPRAAAAGGERPPATSTATSIDEAALEALRELDSGSGGSILVELVTLFTTGTPARIAKMREAVSRGDRLTVAREAHGLKSGSAHLGAHGMKDLARRLEDLARGGGLVGAAELLAELEREFAAAARELAKHAAIC